jgi:hypothetical protein
MGIQDRDYHREWWAKKTGYVERAAFRVALGRPRWRREERPGGERFIVPLLLTFALCTAVFVALKLVVKLLV